MTIIVPKNYHLCQSLRERRILCIGREEALHEDIRALRIGILNIMPKAEAYEFNLLHPLGRSVLQIDPVWIRLKTHRYQSSDGEHLRNLYVSFEDAVARSPLDGLILTGAPVEEIPFESVTYWDEVKQVLNYARGHIPITLGICWGGSALARQLGIDKVIYPRKLFGVFETRNLDRHHPITGEMDDVFWCPQSRFSGIPDAVMERERDRGTINLLAYSPEAGYTIFESADHRYLMHLGHPEYDAQRLVAEYIRDVEAGKPGVERPKNLDIELPVNRWKGQGFEFFSQWIKYIHDCVSFDRESNGAGKEGAAGKRGEKGRAEQNPADTRQGGLNLELNEE
jgi:homoserine O-succinyltransferase